tara:strand:- start:730 stop:1044 length:315 start_codon:yes stop_codon:yes gene_type:complete
MLFWIIQQTIISIILIISVHYIYIFFKNNLTIPKTKDLVNKPAEQYKKIYSSLNENKPDTKEMKNELKNYLKNLSSTKNKIVKQPKPSIQTGENIFSANNFTNF